MPKWVPIFWAICIWFSIALIGYGVALQKFGAEEGARAKGAAEVSGGERPDPAREVLEARVSQVSVSDDGVRLTLESDPRAFDIAPDRTDRATWGAVRSGTKLRLRLQGNHVVDVMLNPGTPFQRNLIRAAGSLEVAKSRADRANAKGRALVLAGALAALTPVIHAGIRSWRKRRRLSAGAG